MFGWSGGRSVAMSAVFGGFYGKIAARGDFVRAGLPRSFIDPWDSWMQRMVAGSRDAMGEQWLPCWLEAPIWRFALGPDICGPDPVRGVWMPSVDSVGRYFPLVFALVGPEGTDDRADDSVDPWLAAAEQVGLDALEQGLLPDAMAAQLPPAPAALGQRADDRDQWHTAGAPRVPATRFFRHCLPDTQEFLAMLDAGSAA